MAKRNTEWTKEKIDRYIQEGRGQGEKEQYVPWLKIQDFPSLGRATRVFGKTTRRIHHFFSDIQLRYFYLLEWEPKVIDIREHFPLLDFDEVIEDKSDLNIKLFTDKKNNIPYILATTFLITVLKADGENVHVARAVKGASELNSKKSTLEKLEMERRYWKEKGIDFAIVTNKDIPMQRSKNIEWIYSSIYSEQGTSYTYNDINEVEQGLFERLHDNKNPVRKIFAGFENDYGLENGMGILIFKYLIADKKVIINIDEPIDLNKAGSFFIP